jgi:hypothetical protein
MTTDEYKAKLDAFQAFLNGAKADPNPDVGHFAGQKQETLDTDLGWFSQGMDRVQKEIEDYKKDRQPPEGFVPPR